MGWSLDPGGSYWRISSVIGNRYGADYVIEMDADSSHDPVHIPRWLAEANDRPVAIGSRLLPGARQIDRTLVRILMTRLANQYRAWLFGLPVKECLGEFKCYSRLAINAFDWDYFISEGYSIGAEMRAQLAGKGFAFKKIPIAFVERKHGWSKCSLKVMIDFARSIHHLKAKLSAPRI